MGVLFQKFHIAQIVVEGFEENATLLRITICEGKNRQVRSRER